MENILYALLGWLAGILSSFLLEWNRNRRITASLRVALQFEMVEYRYRMTGVVFMLASRSNALSPELINWLLGHFKAYPERGTHNEAVEALESLAANPAATKQSAAQFAASASQKTLGLKKYPTPALDAAVASVSLFTPKEQRAILEVRTLVSNYDSVVDEVWRFFERTFDSSLNDSNRAKIDKNLETAGTQALHVCQRIADHAAELARP